jgi:hypothetical protein
LLEDAQRKAARARLPVTDQTLTVLASTAFLAADTLPCTTKLWEELDPTDKTWAAWKTAYLAAHKKRANRLRATGGLITWAGPTQPKPTTNNHNTGLLDSINNAMDNLVSAATNKKAILATSNTTLTNQIKVLCDQPRLGAEEGEAAMTPIGRRDLTPPATADPMDTMLVMGRPATPAPIPWKTTSPPPLVPTSWVDP